MKTRGKKLLLFFLWGYFFTKKPLMSQRDYRFAASKMNNKIAL